MFANFMLTLTWLVASVVVASPVVASGFVTWGLVASRFVPSGVADAAAARFLVSDRYYRAAAAV